MPTIPLPEPPLGDGVVALRPPTPDDVGLLLGLWRDVDVRRWTGAPPEPTSALAAAWIASRDRRRRGGRGLDLVVVPAGGGAGLGTVSLDDVDAGRRTAALGYAVAAPARGLGVARRAVALLAGWALAPGPAPAGGPGLARVALRIHAGNAASARVAAAAGFAPVAAGPDPDDGRPVVTWWRWAPAASASSGRAAASLRA
jgi:RimJ/RimL family protein N-acetyltransferase